MEARQRGHLKARVFDFSTRPGSTEDFSSVVRPPSILQSSPFASGSLPEAAVRTSSSRPFRLRPSFSASSHTKRPAHCEPVSPISPPSSLASFLSQSPMQPTETRFLTRASAGRAVAGAVSGYASDPIRRLVPLSDTNPDDCLVAHPADGRLRTILAPEDPVRMLLRHRAAVEQLRMAVGSRKLSKRTSCPPWRAGPRWSRDFLETKRGLWSGPDGLFEAGLMFARGAINAVDARVIGPELAPGIRDDWTLRLRIASALAGLMSDSRKLAALKLEAGSEILPRAPSPSRAASILRKKRHCRFACTRSGA